MKINKKKLGVWIGSIITVTALVGSFFANYELLFKSPVNMQFHLPVEIAKRIPKIITVTEIAKAEDNNSPLTPDQQYLCNKFGADCKMALAIQRAENGAGKCEVYNINSNGSLDWGYFQINTVHLKKVGVNLKDLLDCKANTDFAYKLFKEQGWNPWTVYKNGSYKKYLIN